MAKTTGNSIKYESFREAWRRIAAATAAGFFLEAIVIQESLISDRLVSYLSRPDASRPLRQNKRNQWPSFGHLIGKLREEHPSGIAVGTTRDIIQDLDKWRICRNRAVHALAKSDPGRPTTNIQDFLHLAEETATTGNKLARAVLSWHRREKRSSEALQPTGHARPDATAKRRSRGSRR